MTPVIGKGIHPRLRFTEILAGSEEGPEEMMAPIESVPSSGEASEKNPFPLPFADDEDEEPEQEHTEEEPQTEEPVPDDIEGTGRALRSRQSQIRGHKGTNVLNCRRRP